MTHFESAAILVALARREIIAQNKLLNDDIFGTSERKSIQNIDAFLYMAEGELFIKTGVAFIEQIPGFETIQKGIEQLLNKNEKPEDSEPVVFKTFYKAYPSRKRGCDTEFNNFKKKYSNYKKLLSLLLPAIEAQKEHHVQLKDVTGFSPSFPNMSTWINNRRWEDVLEPINKQKNGNTTGYINENRPGKRYSSGNLHSEERKAGIDDLKNLAYAILQSNASEDGN